MNPTRFCIVTIIFFSCNLSIDVKDAPNTRSIDTAVSNTKKNSKLIYIDSSFEDKKIKKNIVFTYKDFETFYLQFIKDSIFQISRVKFPLKGQYQDYDTSIEWSKSKWINMGWDLRDAFNYEDSINVIQTQKKFFYGSYCECGFSFEMEFNKINNNWFLTYRQENNF